MVLHPAQLLEHAGGRKDGAARQEVREQRAQDREDLALARRVGRLLEAVEQRREHIAAEIATHLELDLLLQGLHLARVERVERRVEVVAVDDSLGLLLLRGLLLRCGLLFLPLLLEDPLELGLRSARPRHRDLHAFREHVDVLVLEVDEVRFP